LSIYRIHVLSGAAWSSVLHVWLIMQRSWVWAPSEAPSCFIALSKTLYP